MNDDNIIVTLEKSDVKQMEVLLLKTNVNLDGKTVHINLNGVSIENTVAGKNIGFSIPDFPTGSYPLIADVDGVKHPFEIHIMELNNISNPSVYLDEYFTNTSQDIMKYRSFQDSLVSEGVIDSVLAYSNRAYWDNIKQLAQNEYAQLTSMQKERLALLLESNKDWLSNLDKSLIGYWSFKNNSVEDCRILIKQGRDILKANPSFTQRMQAARLSIEAYYCGLTEKIKHDHSDEIGKVATLLRNSENQFIHFTLINLIGEKVENVTKEIDQLGKSPSIAESVEKSGVYKTTSVIPFCNAQPVNFYLTVNYRSLNPNDVNSNLPYGDFAKMFENVILAYDDYVDAMNEPLLYKPSYGSVTRKLDMNTFLSVPSGGISNNKVTLLNTQMTNSDWQLFFATDEATTQDFSFDVIYDDGYARLSHSVAATISDCGSSVTDIDGNVYQTVNIAGLYWMKENLKTTHFSDGSVIEERETDSLWEYSNIGEVSAWCYYDQNSSYNNDYGKLYNWYAVNDSRNVCPVGWHVPSEFEWMSMIDYLGGASVAGGKLKEVGTLHWNSPNVDASDSSGFAGLPGGIRMFGYNDIGTRGVWWTSDGYNSTSAYSYFVSSYDTYASPEIHNKIFGASVRCVKDY